MKRFEAVEEYIAAQPEAAQSALRRVRSAIRKAVPTGTVRFPLSGTIPVKLIERIAKFRATE